MAKRQARFAEGTTVSINSTKQEIMELVEKHADSEAIVFTCNGWPTATFGKDGRLYKFDVPAVDPDDRYITHTDTGRLRIGEARKNAIAAEERRLWRALLLILKAKFEILRAVPVTFEQEFLSNLVLPNRRTVGEHFTPIIEDAINQGELPTSMMALPMGKTEVVKYGK